MFFGSSFPVDGKLVVISGASQGLGAELAKQVFAKGASVLISARSKDKLAALCDEMNKDKVHDDQLASYVAGDLSTYAGCEAVFAQLGDRVPDIVMCCAGFSIPKLFMDLTPEELTQGVSANYLTALYFAHAAMKSMISLNDYDTVQRHIVFFSSVVAFFPFIGYGQYAPTKAAVKSLSDVLRQEGLQYNIKVETIFPGNFMSEGFIEEQKVKPEIVKTIEGPSDPIPIDQCASGILKSLDRGYQYVTTDLIGWVLNCLVLGDGPRTYWPLQILMGFLWLFIAPIAKWFIDNQVITYFKKEKSKKNN